MEQLAMLLKTNQTGYVDPPNLVISLFPASGLRAPHLYC